MKKKEDMKKKKYYLDIWKRLNKRKKISQSILELYNSL